MLNNQRLDKEQKVFLEILSSSVHQTNLSDISLNAKEWDRVLWSYVKI